MIIRFDSAVRRSFCRGRCFLGSILDNFIGTELGNFESSCPKGRNCGGAVDTIFVDLDLILATTSEATPACMAMYGPNINEEEIQNSSEENYDQCGVLFDLQEDRTGAETYDYAKWVDLKCNQRTRSLICTILGKFSKAK